MPDSLPPLRTHAAPLGLLDAALLRAASRPPSGRSPRPLLLAAVFLLGVLAGRFVPNGSAPGPAVEPENIVARYEAELAARPVRFIFVAPEAERVAIAGSWNDWQPEAAPMQRGEGGRFYVEIELPSGQYEYQFVVDGHRWTADPATVLARDDGFGRQNSVLTI